MMEHYPSKVKAVEVRPGHRLAVTWDVAAQMVIDFTPTITQGGVFVPLEDQATFERVRIGEHGWTIFWPEPRARDGQPLIDIDAESLFVMAMQQRQQRELQRMAKLAHSVAEGQSKTTT